MSEFNLFKEEFVDILILGYYNNEVYIKEFLEHLFYEKKITNDKILNTPFFTEETTEHSLIDVILPFSSLPKNFNNNKNTFLDKKNKYFQINITLPNQKKTDKELNTLIKSFQMLIENKYNFIIVFKRKFYDTIPGIKLIFKDKIKQINLNNNEDLELIETVIPKLHKKFYFNFI